MLPSSLLLLCLAAIHARAQSDSSSPTTTSTTSTTSTTTSSAERTNRETSIGADTRSFSTITADISTEAFTGSEYTYLSYDTAQSTLPLTVISGSNATATSTGSDTGSQSTVSSSTAVSLTQLIGTTATASSTSNSTTSSTSSAAQPSNTLPCNGYPEFCNRQYSNITEVCAHNSAFVVKNNAGSNQMLSVQDQLNDGVRMLQGQTHWVNDTVYNCHTTCDLLNAGPWQSQLEAMADWLRRNPYDVLTFLIGNSDFVDVSHYVDPIQNSGLAPYLYTPEYVPQHRDQWPTLGEMILRNERMVFFMDYNANQTEVPYILDEFSHIFETPFSPTDPDFPCTKQRPPESSTTDAEANKTFMYIANHNLNVAISLSALGFGDSEDILVPNSAQINKTNSDATSSGALGAMSVNCTETWGRPPNFLLVDYYNLGNFPGSVFQVAAEANGVQYTKACCGVNSNAASGLKLSIGALVAALAVAFTIIS